MRSYRSIEASSLEETLRILNKCPVKLIKIYPKSFCSLDGMTYGLIGTDEGQKLTVLGEKASVLDDPFHGICHHVDLTIKICDLSRENTQCLMTLFPYTKPAPLHKEPLTIGIEDFMGLTAPAYLRAIRNFCVKPILMHQPELDFYGRIQDAPWSVFQENYREGYGFDAGPLKSLSEVKSALEAGVSMVTLDLSEKLNPEAFKETKAKVEQRMKEEIDEGDSAVFNHYFLNKAFQFKNPLREIFIQFDEETIQRNILFFHKAIDFAEEVYESVRRKSGYQPLFDFGISIDKANFLTSSQSHLFLIIALRHRGVRIDYFEPQMRGDGGAVGSSGTNDAFLRQAYEHLLIAQDYGGYKISIHPGNGSNSFLPKLGEPAKGGLHIKMTGTSRIEAMRLIDLVHPFLLTEIHESVSSVSAKTKHLDPTAAFERISKPKENLGNELSAPLDRSDLRYALHVMKDTIYKDRIYSFLSRYEEDYWDSLQNQIEGYLVSLGVEKTKGNGGEEERNHPFCEGGIQ
jgi:hypothetical protein